MKLQTSPLALAAVLLLSACGQETTPTSPDSPEAHNAKAPASPSLPQGFFLAAAPDDAVPLHQARASAAPGEPLAFTGYIGGRAEPFTEGRALFLVADAEKAPACTDTCPIPWDACCTPSDVIAANSATVRVTDEQGQTLRLGLEGLNGLVPGATITVVGTVHEASDAVLVVDAHGIALKR